MSVIRRLHCILLKLYYVIYYYCRYIIWIHNYKRTLEHFVKCSLNQEYIDKTMESEEVQLIIKNAEAVCTMAVEVGKPEELPKSRRTYSNPKSKHIIEIPVKFCKSKELGKQKNSGWSMIGTLGCKYYAEGSVTAKCQRSKTEIEIDRSGIEVLQTFREEYVTKHPSSIEAAVVEREIKYTAKVKGLKLTFPSDTKLRTGRLPLQKKLLSKIFEENGIEITVQGDKRTVEVEIDGKFEAMFVKRGVEVYPSS